MTLLVPDVRHYLYETYGAEALGRYSVASDFDTDGLTDARIFNSTIGNVGQYVNKGVFRPNQPDPDRYKRLGRINTGTHKATIADTAYVNIIDLDWELLPPDIDPDIDIMKTIEESQNLLFFPNLQPNFLFVDGDCSLGGTSEWDDADTDEEKTSNQRYNESGFRSLQLTFTATGYVQQLTPLAGINPLDRLALYACPIVISGGPVSWEIINHDTGVTIPCANGVTQFSAASRVPLTMGGLFNVPAGCDRINQKIGAPSGTIVAFDCFPGANLNDLRMPAPASLDAPHKLIGFGPANYSHLISTGVYSSRSRRLNTWKRKVDYGDPEPSLADATAPRLPIYRDQLPEADYWYYVYRPWSDRYPMDGEQKGTEAPPALVKAAAAYLMGVRLRVKRHTAGYDDLIKYNAAILDAQFKAEMPTPPPQEPDVTVMGGRSGAGW